MKYLLSIIFITFSIVANAQNVGINTAAPQQMLDINGKIVLSDDATIPTAGAIRYNSTLKQHEGFNGTEWVSLYGKATGSLPTNPVPVYGFGTLSPSNVESLFFKRMSDDAGTFVQVPTGKYLIITNVFVHSNNLGTSGRMIFGLGPNVSVDSYPSFSKRLVVNVLRDTPYSLSSGGGAPLFIVKAGDYFNTFCDVNSASAIDFKVQGFLVDDLNY